MPDAVVIRDALAIVECTSAADQEAAGEQVDQAGDIQVRVNGWEYEHDHPSLEQIAKHRVASVAILALELEDDPSDSDHPGRCPHAVAFDASDQVSHERAVASRDDDKDRTVVDAAKMPFPFQTAGVVIQGGTGKQNDPSHRADRCSENVESGSVEPGVFNEGDRTDAGEEGSEAVGNDINHLLRECLVRDWAALNVIHG